MNEPSNATRQVFKDDIANAIRKSIFSGELKPGDRIKELHWAEELGVSQGPVREALRDLEAQGLVETVPFKGSRVRTFTKKEVEDNYSVRMCLEKKSLGDAIRMLDDAQMKALCAELGKVMVQMDECAANADLIGFTACDTEFHRLIIVSTGNEVLLRLWLQCNMRNWFVVTPELNNAEILKELQKGHKKVIEALASRDKVLARQLMEDHLVTIMNRYIEKI